MKLLTFRYCHVLLLPSILLASRTQGLESSVYPSTTGSPQTTPSLKSLALPTNPTGPTTDPSRSNGTDIPGVWYSACRFDGAWPCMAYCSTADVRCQQSASSIARACAPSWASYESVQSGLRPTGPKWHNTTSVVSYSNPGGTRTTEVDVYTSFVTATEGFVVGFSSVSTMTPVYALGSPVQSIITTSEPLYPEPTYTVLTAPTPNCKYNSYSTKDRSDCGRCTITGGTVDLYFWPPSPTSNLRHIPTSDQNTIRSAILNGHTLVSPTVYISVHTIFASDSCLQVGQRHTGTLVAMNPADISTQIHIGGKVAAYTYGQLNYNDLTGLPPASQYEAQPSCLHVGCPTIYFTSWDPTLVVPSQVRTIDPAWASCALALDGFYDPPIALSERNVEATMTISSNAAGQTAYPHSTPHVDGPEATWSPTTPPTLTQTGEHAGALATVVQSALQTEKSKSMGRKTQSTISQASNTITEGEHGVSSTLPTQDDPAPTDNGSQQTSTNAPFPSALPSAGGVVIASHTMRPGDVETMGPAGSATVISVLTEGSSTYVVYDHTSTVAVEAMQTTSHNRESISINSKSQYVVDGQTLAPGSPITLTGDNGPVTFRMLTSKSQTFIALGTTTTVHLDQNTPTAAPLAFTRASNGNFVLHGTTLVSGKPITIGRGAHRTTLRMTTVGTAPAIVINGNTTELLGHQPLSSSVAMPGNATLPVITRASAPPVATGGSFGTPSSASTTSGASSARIEVGLGVQCFIVAMLLYMM